MQQVGNQTLSLMTWVLVGQLVLMAGFIAWRGQLKTSKRFLALCTLGAMLFYLFIRYVGIWPNWVNMVGLYLFGGAAFFLWYRTGGFHRFFGFKK